MIKIKIFFFKEMFVGKIKIKGDSYRVKELATRPLPSFWQNVSEHWVLLNVLEKLIVKVTLTELYHN